MSERARVSGTEKRIHDFTLPRRGVPGCPRPQRGAEGGARAPLATGWRSPKRPREGFGEAPLPDAGVPALALQAPSLQSKTSSEGASYT